MNIVIFAGGTGSIALQQGLHANLGGNLNQHKIQIIANYYDNGLSTGLVRQVFGGKILGPSDLRKNQSTYAELVKSYDELPGGKGLREFLGQRITKSAGEVEDYMIGQIRNLEVDHDRQELLTTATKFFLAQPVSKNIDYNDFSVANIIYAAVAAMNGNSLFAAGRIMAKLIGIPEDRVIGNSDKSLFLKAETASGHVLHDEEDIVAWDRTDDRISRIFFEDENGHVSSPKISEEAATAIHYADIIIFSSGTQWSSLIPTYVTEGMREAISESKAKKYLVMNNVADRDMQGMSSIDVMEILSKYLNLVDITTIYNAQSAPEMHQVSTLNRGIVADLSYNPEAALTWNTIHGSDMANSMVKKVSKVHNQYMLAGTILSDYYADLLNSAKFAFDFDDTLVARGNEMPKISASNIELINNISSNLASLGRDRISIITGNTIKALPTSKFSNIDVYADGGVNKYKIESEVDPQTYDRTHSVRFDKCLNPNLLLEDSVIDVIVQKIASLGIHSSKIRVRGNAMVSIKPLDPEYRQSVVTGLRFLLQGYEWYEHLQIRITGRTTIDISNVGLDKQAAFYDESFLKLKANEITYLGDELFKGNDKCLLTKAKCLSVNSPIDTNAFLLVLSNYVSNLIRESTE